MITQYITLDFMKRYLVPININQYEVDSRDFVFTCKSGDIPIDLTSASVTFYAKKPDGNILFNACTIIDAAAGKIQYTVTEQTCAAAGSLTCWILIVISGEELRCMPFTVTVIAGEDDSEAIESTSEFTALDAALALVSGHEARLTAAESDIDDLETAMSGAESDIDNAENDIGDLQNIVNNQNFIINGGFDVWQRGISQTSDGYGSADRWFHGNSGTTKTHSRQSFTPGQTDVPNNPDYYSRTVVSSVAGASYYAYQQQRIENVAQFSGETMTLSFWAKADSSKNIAISFKQNFGSGGSADVSGIESQKIALTSSWQKFIITLSIPSVSGKTIGADNYLAVYFWFDAGSSFDARTDTLGQQSGTFDLAQIKFEKGSIATPFIPRTFAEERALCQGYYWQGEVVNSSGIYYGTAGSGRMAGSLSFPVPMRTTPTINTLSAPSYLNCSSVAPLADNNGILLRVTATTDGAYRAINGVYEADAEL